VTAEETSLAEDAAEAEQLERPDDGGKPGRLKRFTGRIKQLLHGRTLPAILAFLMLVSAALAAFMLYFWYRPDRATDALAAKSAITAASEGTVAILSYSPDTFDRDFASAKSHLTGDFLSYYDNFTQQIVAPAAKQKSVKTTAVVVRAAVSELHLNSAVVLVFVNQSTMSADRTDPTLNSSSVLVTLTKARGEWLISSFNPV
jgi:Mce-associated membrane protein